MATRKSGATARVDWLERQFNNRARVPDHPEYFKRWADSSLVVRERADALVDVPYGGGPNESLDVFGVAPVGTGKPVLVFIHGGWWRSLDKSDHSFVAPAFVDSGALVVVPNYALCPGVTIGDIALQMTQAIAHVVRQAAQWGGDASRLVVAGHSAGGHLAAMLLCCDWSKVGADLSAQVVRRAVSLSGLSDLTALRDTPSLQRDLQLSALDALRLSPAEFPAPTGGTLAAFVGGLESEEFLRQNALFADQWGMACVPVTEVIEGRNHFSIVDDLADPASRIHHQVRDWLE